TCITQSCVIFVFFLDSTEHKSVELFFAGTQRFFPLRFVCHAHTQPPPATPASRQAIDSSCAFAEADIHISGEHPLYLFPVPCRKHRCHSLLVPQKRMRIFAFIMALGAAVAGTSSTQKDAIGCFADDQSDRVLAAKWSSHAMTPEACAVYCVKQSSGYVYYATQSGQECWCQDENIDLRHGEGTCDFRCSGDERTVCGGFDSFSLYKLEEAVVPSSPTDDSYVGCFADDRDDRVLVAMTSSREMTSEVCAAYCADNSSRNKYYATQYGEECWCAASVDLRHGEGTCDYACTGAPGKTCGGSDAFDLFELESPSPPLEDYYLGCFADDRDDRVLEDKTSSGDMTVQVCEDYCIARNKPFFAVQWGNECWCGGCELLDDGQHRYDRHGPTSCSGYPCTGETSRDCGSFDAFSLYYRGTCGGPATASPTGFPTMGHPMTSTSETWTFPPTATPSASPTTAPIIGSESQFLSWLYEGTEVKIGEAAEWDAIMWFEIPDSGGQLAELYYSDERLQEIQVDTEVYRVEYDTNGEFSDLILVDFNDRRLLESGEQGDYHLPSWLNANTIQDVMTSRIECDLCNSLVTIVCTASFRGCGEIKVSSLLTLALRTTCEAVGLACSYNAGVPGEFDACKDFFCCDRSKCGKFGDCYDEVGEQCCDDGSAVPMNGCCAGDDLDFTCGEASLGSDGVRPLLCYDPDTEQCCGPNDFIRPKSECCPGQEECGGKCYDASKFQCCDGTVATCCNEEVPCGDRCHDTQKTQCCPDGNILDQDECCAGLVGFNGAVNCCADGSIVQANECCPGQEKCQGTCYDPTTRECCEQGPLVEGCPRACDDGSTVLKANGECCPNEVQCLYGSSCYIPEKSICCEDDTVVDIGATCPLDTPPTPAPTTPAPQPIQNVVPKRGGSVDGDPHIRLYDGGSGYDCHGQGEFVITKAATTDSEVQGRFQQWSQNPNPAVTVTTSVAMREGSSSVVQASPAASGGLEVLVDGEPYDEVAGVVTGVALEVTSAKVEMRFPSGLDVFVFVTSNGILRVNVYAPLDLATTGLLGNNNGELYDDWKTVDGEIVEFAVPGRPTTVAEGTNYCTTNWCTTQETSIFAYADGEDHGTFDLCDAVYSPPVLPDVVPASTTDLCGDNANCIFDALLAGEDVGQATLEGEEADRLYQEAIGGLCASNSFSSTGMPPCTACPAGEVSGTGATSCILEQEAVGGLNTPHNIPENIAAAMLADAAGGFAGPGSLTRSPAGTIELTEADLGSVSLSGTFVRDDSAELPLSASVFFYVENAEHPDDFFRGHEDLATFTGDFSKVVTDIPVGSSRLFLSFVVEDPAEALNGAEAAAGSVFTLDVSNMGCTPSLTITLEVGTARASLFVTEPGGKSVAGFMDNGYGDVGFFQNVERFAVQNYIIYSGLDPGIGLMLGEFEASLVVLSNPMPSPMFLTARVSGEVVWTEEIVEDSDSHFTVSLTDYDPSCGGNP
ncbi:unnamed protein product, partial [Ectocarpus sp. 13 AM-2016]